MKLSDVIKYLQDMHKEEGDIEVIDIRIVANDGYGTDGFTLKKLDEQNSYRISEGCIYTHIISQMKGGE